MPDSVSFYSFFFFFGLFFLVSILLLLFFFNKIHSNIKYLNFNVSTHPQAETS